MRAELVQGIETIDAEVWEESLKEEEYGKLQQQVSGYLQSGERDKATAAIDSYMGTNSALNSSVGSQAVTEHLAEVQELLEEVKEAFEGADAPAKRNSLSKEQQAAGWDKRRAGSKYKDNP